LVFRELFKIILLHILAGDVLHRVDDIRLLRLHSLRFAVVLSAAGGGRWTVLGSASTGLSTHRLVPVLFREGSGALLLRGILLLDLLLFFQLMRFLVP